MDGRTRTSLFLMEQVIAITVFAVCAAVCVAIFTDAFYRANDAKDINYALIAAKNGAEAYKVYGSAHEAAAALGGYAQTSSGATVYYDKNWRVCEESDAAFILRLNEQEGIPDSLSLQTQNTEIKREARYSELSIERITGEELIAFIVAAG